MVDVVDFVVEVVEVVGVVVGSSVVVVGVSETEEVVFPVAGVEVILEVASMVDVEKVVDTMPVDV